MQIRWNYIQGSFSQVEESLRRTLGQLSRHHDVLYVGATYDPITRAKQHRRRDTYWSELILLWRTTSYRNAVKAEKTLIDWARENVENLKDGGEGLKPDGEEYFIYVLV